MACKDGHALEPGLFFRRAATLEFQDNAGRLHVMHYSGACNHCQDPACVANCPSGAMHRQNDGTVAVDSGQCIGCGTCTWACIERRQAGKEPLCVEACLTHCLRFVDLDALPKTEKTQYTDTLPILPDQEKTHPHLLILAKEGAYGK